jgi:hypothetical protein
VRVEGDAHVLAIEVSAPYEEALEGLALGGEEVFEDFDVHL